MGLGEILLAAGAIVPTLASLAAALYARANGRRLQARRKEADLLKQIAVLSRALAKANPENIALAVNARLAEEAALESIGERRSNGNSSRDGQ